MLSYTNSSECRFEEGKCASQTTLGNSGTFLTMFSRGSQIIISDAAADQVKLKKA